MSTCAGRHEAPWGLSAEPKNPRPGTHRKARVR